MFVQVDMLQTDVRTVKPMAEGSYGCIYPEEDAPPCKTDKKEKGIRKVRKVLKKDDAKIELTTSKLIQSIPLWEYYFVVQEETGCTDKNFKKARPAYEGFCKIFKKSEDKNLTELSSPYRGTSLRNLRITDSFLFIESFKHLLTGLSLLHKQGICHFDIHAGNILEENGFLRLIDFGSSFKSDSIDKSVIRRHSYMFTSDFPTQPPELSIQNGIYHNLSVEYCIDELLLNREVFRNGLPYTGITTFYVKSKLSLIGNYIGTTEEEWVKFYNKHWKKFDTWSLGVVFFNILKQCILLPSFKPVWKEHQTLITTVLRGCLEPHPTCRFSADEALSYFSAAAAASSATAAALALGKITSSFFDSDALH
jgi:serine/threonine protein kinase